MKQFEFYIIINALAFLFLVFIHLCNKHKNACFIS